MRYFFGHRRPKYLEVCTFLPRLATSPLIRKGCRRASRSYVVASALSVVLLAAAGVTSTFGQELPAPVGNVNDFAEVLDNAQHETLEGQLAELERATSAEVAVATIKSLDGRSVEDYATALFKNWGIGKRGRDNGVLILVAVDDRVMRIEVGYGLEGVLPDGLTGAIMRETFLPRFRANDYPAGILEGTARVAAIVGRNEILTDAQRAALDRAADEARRSWGMAAFLALFVAAGAFMAGTAAGARVLVQFVGGLVFIAGPLFVASLAAPRAAVWLLALLAVGIVVAGFRLGRRPDWRDQLRGSTKRGSGGWVTGGGTSSGSRSGSSSFGGGRSGGGGATGRW